MSLHSIAELQAYAALRGERSSSVSWKDVSQLSVLPSIFGGRYIRQIQESFNSEGQRLIAQAHRAYCEIQQQWAAQRSIYRPEDFPQTALLMNAFSLTKGRERVFQNGRKHSFSILPFSLFQSATPSPGLDQVRRIRSLGLDIFARVVREEHPQGSDSDKLTVLKLLCNTGAFVRDSEPIYFLDLVYKWGGDPVLDKLKRWIGIGEWFPRKIDGVEGVAPPLQGQPFQDFLIGITLHDLETKLGIRFSESLCSHLAVIFRDESIRSDMLWFVTHSRQAVVKDWSHVDSPSKNYLLALQHYFSLSKQYDCGEEFKPQLLEMCIHRDPRIETPAPSEDRGALQMALEATLGVTDQMNDPYTYPLLLFFLEQGAERRRRFKDLFTALKRIPGLTLRPEAVYTFCQTNREAVVALFDRFEITYSAVIEMLKKRKDVWGAEALFLTPPVVLTYQNNLKLGDAVAQAERLLSLVDAYGFQYKPPFFALLRAFIFRPAAPFFDLLEKDGEVLGIKKVDEVFLARVIAEGAHLEHPALSLERDTAKNWVLGLCQTRQFSSAEKFSLYLEALRVLLAKDGTLGKFRQVTQFVHELKKHLKLVLPDDILYYFYRHHPLPRSPEPLACAREEFLSRNQSEFQWNLKETQGVVQTIQAFWEDLFEPGSFEDRSRVVASCVTRTCNVFFPPLQPLVDFLRISGFPIDAKDRGGVRWMSPHLEAHNGQMKSVPGTADLAVYCSWYLNPRHYPVLSISTTDLEGARTRSASVVLDIPQIDMTDERRGQVFGALFQLSQTMLANSELFVDTDLAPEEEQIIRGFVSQAKILYQRTYWDMLTGKSMPTTPSLPLRDMAAEGNISSSGSLIPDHFLQEQVNMSFYTACAEWLAFEESPNLINPFKERTDQRQPLKVVLIVTADEEKPTRLPIFLRACSVEQFTRQEEEKWDGRAPSKETTSGAYVTLGVDVAPGKVLQVTLQYPEKAFGYQEIFRTRFQFQILQLKARWYREYALRRARAATLVQNWELGAAAARPPVVIPEGDV